LLPSDVFFLYWIIPQPSHISILLHPPHGALVQLRIALVLGLGITNEPKIDIFPLPSLYLPTGLDEEPKRV